MKRHQLWLLVLVTLSPSARANEGSWEPMGTKEGVQLFRKEVPGSSLIAFRGDGIIDAPLVKVATICLDDDRAQEWVDSLVESKVVRVVNPSEYIEFNHIGMPPLVSDRDFVTDVKMTVDPDTKTFTMYYRSVDDPAMPAGKYVRGEMFYTSLVMTSIENGTKTRMQAELHADPKGWLPKWLVNFFQKDWAVATFRGARMQSKKTDVKRPPVFEDILNRVEKITQ